MLVPPGIGECGKRPPQLARQGRFAIRVDDFGATVVQMLALDRFLTAAFLDLWGWQRAKARFADLHGPVTRNAQTGVCDLTGGKGQR